MSRLNVSMIAVRIRTLDRHRAGNAVRFHSPGQLAEFAGREFGRWVIATIARIHIAPDSNLHVITNSIKYLTLRRPDCWDCDAFAKLENHQRYFHRCVGGIG